MNSEADEINNEVSLDDEGVSKKLDKIIALLERLVADKEGDGGVSTMDRVVIEGVEYFKGTPPDELTVRPVTISRDDSVLYLGVDRKAIFVLHIDTLGWYVSDCKERLPVARVYLKDAPETMECIEEGPHYYMVDEERAVFGVGRIMRTLEDGTSLLTIRRIRLGINHD